MRKFVWLFVLFLAACAPPPASISTSVAADVATTNPFNLVVPTPPASDMLGENGRSYPEPSTPAPMETAVPTRQLANSWQTYHHPLHNIGLAYPTHWEQMINGTTIVLRNQSSSTQACTTAQPPIELAFTSFTVDPNVTTTNWLYGRLGGENRMVETLEEGFTGSYPSLLSIAKGEETAVFTEILIRFTPNTLLLIELSTPDTRFLPDVQAIFNSLAAPDQPIVIPAAPPSDTIPACNE
ncbi:MAG: hypothetical protein AAF614_00135 [Chloroflexota bacterium]